MVHNYLAKPQDSRKDLPHQLSVSPTALPKKDYKALEKTVLEAGNAIMTGAHSYTGNKSAMVYVLPTNGKGHLSAKELQQIGSKLAKEFPCYAPFMVLDGRSEIGQF